MVMAEYYTHDRLQELWSQIHHLHLTYLDTEDSPQKIEQRNKLEVCIREYLSIAPHNRKWYCPETSAVLKCSASRRDFSGYRAAMAWNAVAMYAGNLLSQPWRNEYKQIKTYCGFYKHQIETNLIGAEAMFEALGYRNVGSGVLALEGPVCPDQVANVSQDSIVAFVECQILKSIWEDVSSSFKISWLDVLEFRESHICSGEQAARMLKYRLQERRYQQQQQQEFLPMRYSYPSPAAGPCLYSHHPCYYPLPMPVAVPHYHSVPPVPMTVPMVRQCNGYCYPHQQQYVCPTGQLIELDAPGQNGQCHYDVVDSAKRPSLESHKALAKSTNLDSLTLSKSREDGAGTFESWDYVYRNLESQGYYKDLAETPDVTRVRAARRNKPSIELEDQINNFNLTDRVRESSSLDNMAHEVNGVDSKSHTNTLTTNITLKSHTPNNTNTIKSHTPNNTIKTPTPNNTNTIKSHTPTTNTKSPTLTNTKSPALLNGTGTQKKKVREKDPSLKEKETIKDNYPTAEVKEKKLSHFCGDTWNCNTCTYLNSAGVEICVMCGKSRRGAGAEAPLQVGGPQCPRCTLVNQREAKKCQACDASLHNSPTYI